MSFLVRLPEDQYPSDALAGIKPDEFNLANARAAAWVSQLTYEDEFEKIQRITGKWSVTELTRFEAITASVLPLSATRGLILGSSKVLFVAFAGTDPVDLANWITNFNFAADAQGIHGGFAHALNAVWPELSALVAKSQLPLFVVGHSLGGALAVLFAERAMDELATNVAAVYTFGMPRVGGELFSRQVNDAIGSRIYRFVHGLDVVPTVPPSELGFRHVGRGIFCKRHTKFRESVLSNRSDDQPQFRNSVVTSVRDRLQRVQAGALLHPATRLDLVGQISRVLPTGIADHLPDRYWRALETQS
jgi:hypothetical protein